MHRRFHSRICLSEANFEPGRRAEHSVVKGVSKSFSRMLQGGAARMRRVVSRFFLKRSRFSLKNTSSIAAAFPSLHLREQCCSGVSNLAFAGAMLLRRSQPCICGSNAAPALPGLHPPEQCCSRASRLTSAGAMLLRRFQACICRNNAAPPFPSLHLPEQCCSAVSRLASAGALLLRRFQACIGRSNAAPPLPDLHRPEHCCSGISCLASNRKHNRCTFSRCVLSLLL